MRFIVISKQVQGLTAEQTATLYTRMAQFYENIPRILPEHINANIQLDSWVPPDVYRLVVNKSFIEQNELLNVFNCGIGFIMIAKSDNVTKIIELLGKHSLTAHEVGSTTQGGNERITFSNSLNMP